MLPLLSNKTDELLAGWVNMDAARTQRFWFLPESHREANLTTVKKIHPVENPFEGEGGHDVKMDSTAEEKFSFAYMNPEQAARYYKTRRLIEVPPGCAIIYSQNLFVAFDDPDGTPEPHMQRRMHFAYRLTTSEQSFSSLKLRNQGVPALASGQTPKMWSVAEWDSTERREKLVEWSNRTFVPAVIDPKFHVVERLMRSLKTHKLPMYPDYQDFESDLFEPRRTWVRHRYRAPIGNVLIGRPQEGLT